MEWHAAVEKLRPHIVRIHTPQGSGTGFLVARSQNAALYGIATAAHVINHANFWEQPIRIQSFETDQAVLVRPADRAILLDEARDTAVIIMDAIGLELPEEPLGLMDEGYVLKVGNTVGWLGFPAIPAASLCFFTGTVSAWVEDHSAYFVDGVAINGVSGGPAFSAVAEEPTIIGVVSAYVPNRVTGEALPGLCIVRDVAQFHGVIPRFRNLDEAKAEEESPVEPPPPTPAPSAEVPSQARRTT